MTPIRVALGDRSYPIVVTDTYATLPQALRRAGLRSPAAIVSNRLVLRRVGRQVIRRLTQAGWSCDIALLPDTERAKSWACAHQLITDLTRRFRGSTPSILAVGGGVVGDTAGFVASILRRGVPYAQVPTTLLAQVDSAIGGKVAVDLPAGKNLVGAFYQPRVVFSNVAVLQSLSARQLRSGLAEALKCGVLADARLFAYVEQHAQALLGARPAALRRLVAWCSRIKARLVSRDERERLGVRTLLNFGHTAGHALEAATSYSDRYTHGEAVSIGMLVAGDLAVALGRWPAAHQQRLERLLRTLGLPTQATGVSPARLLAAMHYDKKHVAGRLRWVLPTRIGHTIVTSNVPPAAVRAALRGRIG